MPAPASPPLPVLTTQRLKLRPIEEADAAGLHSAYGDPLAMQFWDFPARADVAATAECIRRSIGVDPYWHGVWAILTVTGAFAGMINYHHREPWNHRLELGWILSPAFWRRGVMTEAAAAVIDHCFEAMDTHRIEATIEPANAASRALAAKLGFREEGRLRDRACVEGGFRDVLMYALLRPTWRAAPIEPSP